MSGRGNVLVRTAGFFMIPAGFVCFFMSIVYGLLDLDKLADEGGSLGFEKMCIRDSPPPFYSVYHISK